MRWPKFLRDLYARFRKFIEKIIMYWLSFGIFGGTTTETPVDTAVYWDDGITYFRLDIRSGYLFLDQAITVTGFSGVLGIDWAPIWREKKKT